MTEKVNEIINPNSQDIERTNRERERFKKSIVRLNAASSVIKNGTEIAEAELESRCGLNALNAEGALQEMLVAQMLSIHHLQQQAVFLAHGAKDIETIRYFTNASIKLANCFTQQANTLSRLQGNGNQKITVEHVDVHSGGQAIVGNVNGGFPSNKVKK